MLRQENNQKTTLRLTSLIDVIFILLLFFIVTSLIMKQSGGREGERAYVNVQNAFSNVSEVNAYMTIYMFQSGGRIKYRLIHKGAAFSPNNYFSNLTIESQQAAPSAAAIIWTTTTMLLDPGNALSRDMDRINSTSIRQILMAYKRILSNNDMSFAVVAQPGIPFFEVIKLYSFMKSPVAEGGLGSSQVVLLEFNGGLAELLDRINWSPS